MSTSETTRIARLLDPRLWKLLTRGVVIVAAAVIVLFPLSPSMSAQNTVILALVLAIGASGLNIITGYTGYLTLSQGAFVGIGAYVGAILATRFPDVQPLLWVPLAGIIAAVVAMLLGLVTYRSRGPAFVIITVAFLFLVQFVAIEWVPVTNG
jgi:ABC-type branched-subunit amino acid transport system permease subunit